jgi:hypothetical protein
MNVATKRLPINRYDLLVLIAVVFIGILKLPTAFHGDQALFVLGAKKILNGGVLYRDFWDIKQPGIFYFYFLAGMIFSFDEIGIHIFELLFMITFSVFMILALRNYFANRIIVSLIPLFTVGYYYAVCNNVRLTQIEGLVGFPMFLSLWCASLSFQSRDNKRVLLFLSGVFGGIVLLFKLLFLPIVIVFWATTCIYAVRRGERRPLTAILNIGLPVVLGAMVPLLLVVTYFAFHKTLKLLFYTSFELPPRIIRESPAWDIKVKLGNLRRSLNWFIRNFAPLMALSSLGSYVSLSSRRDMITLNLILWCIVGLFVILLQRTSWWTYHFLLLFVPLGLLGALGLDVLLSELSLILATWKGRVTAILSISLLFSYVLSRLLFPSLASVRYYLALYKGSRIEYERLAYGSKAEEVAFLSGKDSLPGKIYVLGNPVYIYLAGREQAIALQGCCPKYYIHEQWWQLVEELGKAVPTYIFVNNYAHKLVRNHSPETLRFLEDNYSVLQKSGNGTWYSISKTSQLTLNH